MICETVEELTPIIGTRPACRALGASPATIYRRRRPPQPRPSRPRPAPPRALSEQEREAVLEVLHSERFVDCAPEQVYATLLDEGRYLASVRTMYRLLAAKHGGVRERRDQLVERRVVSARRVSVVRDGGRRTKERRKLASWVGRVFFPCGRRTWMVVGGAPAVGRDPLPRLGMMVARAAGPSRSGLRPALRAPLTRLS